MAIDVKMAIAHLLNEACVFGHFLTLLRVMALDRRATDGLKQTKKGLNSSESSLGTFFRFPVSNV